VFSKPKGVLTFITACGDFGDVFLKHSGAARLAEKHQIMTHVMEKRNAYFTDIFPPLYNLKSGIVWNSFHFCNLSSRIKILNT